MGLFLNTNVNVDDMTDDEREAYMAEQLNAFAEENFGSGSDDALFAISNVLSNTIQDAYYVDYTNTAQRVLNEATKRIMSAKSKQQAKTIAVRCAVWFDNNGTPRN